METGLTQNIVMNLCERITKGLTNGMREFMKFDNHRALEVGRLHEGLGTFQVRRPTGSQGHPEVTVREGPHELTLRAEEVGTWKSCINVDHMGSSPGKRKTKALKEKTGRVV